MNCEICHGWHDTVNEAAECLEQDELVEWLCDLGTDHDLTPEWIG